MATVLEGLELEEAAAASEDAAEDAVDSRPGMPLLLTGNQLNLDLYSGGCRHLQHLCAQEPPQLLQVEFLRLSTHEDSQLLEDTLARVPWRRLCLRSLVLKGGHIRGALGACLHGTLTTLPAGLSGLASLTHLDLSFNRLETLPDCILELHSLDALLLSHNCLSELPEALGALSTLTFLTVTHNYLERLPTTLGSLSTLQRLDLSENLLDTIPPEIGDLNSLSELNLASNRLPPGRHTTILNTSCPCAGTPQVPEMPRLFLTSDLDSFLVTPHGCSVTLACGVRLQFPAGATTTPVTIHYRLWLPEPGLVSLGPHDFLLSRVLELQPHGVAFQQDVSLWLLFVPPRARRCREVVVRTRSENQWSDLETHLEAEAPKRLWARCQVPHFSWFLVVLRPVSNACLVPPEGALLCSSGHPGVKVTFPPGATEEPRQVSMQVMHMAGRELRALLGEPEASVSPLLCLSQSSPHNFLQPVTVQLPLPPGITGFSLDRSCLHLLYRDPPTATWDDITTQVVLELTHLYARFQVTHFSWYWLWYTTKNCVGGLARKAWERLRLHRVNLIALQRRRDPEQVLLQCLPRNKVDATLRRLLERYRGPEPSDTVEMFEGEKFFAAFERGIDVDADRPDCVDGRICFVFYSHLKNVKEVYITTTLDREAQAVRATFLHPPLSEPHLILPMEVPQERLQGPKGRRQGADFSLLPLNLGDAETGFLTQSNLLSVASRLGPDWPAVALHLGMSYRELQRIRHEFRDDLDGQIRHMLFSWAERQAGQPGAVGVLVKALEQSDRQDVAEEVRAILELGCHKYQDSIRRTGLAPENPSLPGTSASQTPEPTQT
uniref:p53-induced death domain-containing protein 1 n=1 Tax=Nannospalax galili TaxID=1026970 RepID=A0A8C6WBY0_NANGA